MGLGAFNRMRMRRNEAMKAENISKEKEGAKKEEPKKEVVKEDSKKEEKVTLGPRKRKINKE